MSCSKLLSCLSYRYWIIFLFASFEIRFGTLNLKIGSQSFVMSGSMT